jgi:hypothetical protein
VRRSSGAPAASRCGKSPGYANSRMTRRARAATESATRAPPSRFAEPSERLPVGIVAEVLSIQGHAPDCYLEEHQRRSAVAGGDVAYRLIEAVHLFADGLGPATVDSLTQKYNAPARSLSTPSPIGHRSSCPGAEFARRLRAVLPTLAAGLGWSAAIREGRDRPVCRFPGSTVHA